MRWGTGVQIGMVVAAAALALAANHFFLHWVLAIELPIRRLM